MRKPLNIILILILFLSGCATTRRAVPAFPQKYKTIRTVTVMPPQVKIYQYQAGGTTEEMDEWNAQARKVIASALAEFLKSGHDFEVKFVNEAFLHEKYGELWADTEVLYEAVAASAYVHTLGEQKLKTKAAHFDYTLGGEVKPLADGLQTEAFLFIYGYDYVSTKGRVAVQTFNTLAALALSAALGGAFLYIPQHTPTFLSMGLIDGKTGDLLWFKVLPPNRGDNFRKPDALTRIIQWMTEDLKPESGDASQETLSSLSAH